ncbi:MAG: hypothetical protein HY869_20945 [Chloroflexi bacterium]|nr:hypothetical protein [Chloroflexota bacterium]
MTKTLAQLIDAVQEILDATRYPDAACTTAVRQALAQVNLNAPRMLTMEVDDPTALVYNFSADYEPLTLMLQDVLLKDATGGEEHESLAFDPYVNEGSHYFRLRSARAVGETLIVVHGVPHTVSGLDGESVSTLPAWRDQVLVDGACAQACNIRATALAETVNVNKDVVSELRRSAAHFEAAFRAGLDVMASEKPFTGKPSTAAWNDAYHGRDV